MAPPKTRRPGFSRRAQYGLFLGYVVAVAGILVAAPLLVVAIVASTGSNALQGGGLGATKPIRAGGGGGPGFFRRGGGARGEYF